MEETQTPAKMLSKPDMVIFYSCMCASPPCLDPVRMACGRHFQSPHKVCWGNTLWRWLSHKHHCLHKRAALVPWWFFHLFWSEKENPLLNRTDWRGLSHWQQPLMKWSADNKPQLWANFNWTMVYLSWFRILQYYNSLGSFSIWQSN